MIRHLRERWLAPRAPAGYRPGVTLGHLLRNLGPLEILQAQAGTAQLHCPQQRWHAEVHECVEAHLLMHVVTCEFRLEVPALQQGEVQMKLRHTGALRRTGLACVYSGGDKALFARVRDRLAADAALMAALMPLDFKRLTLSCRRGQWHLALEHMGASEVVNRMPALRRYIPISAQQRGHLLASLTSFNQILVHL
ncbi:DUF3156 family protein [Pseudomonas sp. S60]|uniref:DUF3156 family protein n=1 Tax=unclassified Pseudomonas TaxID=196821 RepID=UPI001912ACCA|nr:MULTISPECIES: DUF3156 family protein [unclassified Pseudomonas]MBK5007751.1 DUF3156 family protein [Pseudomonas sp. S32]MBK5012686.1 DUF3156 family protein [Pseudomonas sp. S60]